MTGVATPSPTRCRFLEVFIANSSDLVSAAPAALNVIATGRDAPQALIDLADTVTEMRNLKHAFDRGIRAMRGIDY